MANPFDPKPRNYLLEAILGSDTPPSHPSSLFGSGLENPAFGNLSPFGLPPPPPPPRNNLLKTIEGFGSNASSPFFNSSPPVNSAWALANLFDTQSDFSAFGTPAPRSTDFGRSVYAKPQTKRKAFFSFHYDDIMRVNVVRNAWKIMHPDNALMRSFYDSSLWESRKLDGPEALKKLIREGVQYTSAVCVLIGSETWGRRWVRYEIARAIIDGRGLLAVHLNSIRHHKTLTPHTRGSNPLDYMGIGKPTAAGPYFIYEKNIVPDGFGGWRYEWQRYGDYTNSVSLPNWLSAPATGFIAVLSANAKVYDYIAGDGHKNIGSWIDLAASEVGR